MEAIGQILLWLLGVVLIAVGLSAMPQKVAETVYGVAFVYFGLALILGWNLFGR